MLVAYRYLFNVSGPYINTDFLILASCLLLCMFIEGDHGVKGQGNGWILTVALIEGVNISSLDSSGSSDPCVVFTCNGEKRTSSVELQTHEPQWNGKTFLPLLVRISPFLWERICRFNVLLSTISLKWT